MTDQELMNAAVEARKKSYSPYSKYAVGAALLCQDGTLYTGCNIENAAFTPTTCAERTAVFKAVSEGHRDFVCIAIVGGKHGELAPFCAPCGVCRQVLAEFCPKDFKILLGTPDSFKTYTLGGLLPESFIPGEF